MRKGSIIIGKSKQFLWYQLLLLLSFVTIQDINEDYFNLPPLIEVTKEKIWKLSFYSKVLKDFFYFLNQLAKFKAPIEIFI